MKRVDGDQLSAVLFAILTMTSMVAVVVGTVEDGVGAYDLSVTVADPDIASVVDVSVAGDPGVRDVAVTPNGPNASVRAALMNTSGETDVTVATATVTGKSP